LEEATITREAVDCHSRHQEAESEEEVDAVSEAVLAPEMETLIKEAVVEAVEAMATDAMFLLLATATIETSRLCLVAVACLRTWPEMSGGKGHEN
jgi:hypothetical protein